MIQVETVFYDFPMSKTLTKGGELQTYKNNEALEQALKIWLVSGKGEKIRTLGGGILSPYLHKGLNNTTSNEIRKNILKGLESEFLPKMTVVNLDVIPNTQKERWEISLVAYNSDLSIGLNSFILVRPLT